MKRSSSVLATFGGFVMGAPATSIGRRRVICSAEDTGTDVPSLSWMCDPLEASWSRS